MKKLVIVSILSATLSLFGDTTNNVKCVVATDNWVGFAAYYTNVGVFKYASYTYATNVVDGETVVTTTSTNYLNKKQVFDLWVNETVNRACASYYQQYKASVSAASIKTKEDDLEAEKARVLRQNVNE